MEIGSYESSSLRKATAILTHEEILKCPEFSPQIAPAPGEGKMNVFLCGTVVLKSTVGYTGIDNTAVMSFAQSVDGIDDYSLTLNDVIGVFGGATVDKVITFISVTEAHHADASLFENKGIYLFVWNKGIKFFTGGHPKNTMKVTVYYIVIDL